MWLLEGGKPMDIIRAWKDEEYHNSLSEAERAALPPHPAGLVTLTDEELGAVAGGRVKLTNLTICPDPEPCLTYP
jgi:mersacidin/lichenicidin family type 2 lantibiotic